MVLGTRLATDGAFVEAKEVAGILDFLNTQAQGFDLDFVERGERLSGGERQGIAIARAIINRAPILVLDEPTASIDNTAEVLFLKHFSEYVKDRTLLLVTHKASMLSLVDRLIVLNDGKIIADGPRDEVLKKLAGNPQ